MPAAGYTRAVIGRILVVISSLSLASCSWMFVTPPPSTPPRSGAVRCTETRAAPVFDTIIAVPSVLVALAGVSILADDNETTNDEIGDVFGVLFLIGGGVPAALFGTSAIYGYTRTSRCRDMRAQGGQPQNAPAPQPAPAPGPGPWGTPPPR